VVRLNDDASHSEAPENRPDPAGKPPAPRQYHMIFQPGGRDVHGADIRGLSVFLRKRVDRCGQSGNYRAEDHGDDHSVQRKGVYFLADGSGVESLLEDYEGDFRYGYHSEENREGNDPAVAEKARHHGEDCSFPQGRGSEQPKDNDEP